MWTSVDINNIAFLVSYLKTMSKRCKGKKVQAFLVDELEKMEDMHFQMGIQKGFHKVLSRYPKATRDKVLEKS